MSLSLVFHFISALSFLALIYWVVMLREQVRFSRGLWLRLGQKGEGEAVLVDWPRPFLARLARCLGVAFADEAGKGRGDAPARLEPTHWLELHRECGIVAIRCERDGKAPMMTVQVRTMRECAEPDAWRKRLEGSLASQCHILISTR